MLLFCGLYILYALLIFLYKMLMILASFWGYSGYLTVLTGMD